MLNKIIAVAVAFALCTITCAHGQAEDANLKAQVDSLINDATAKGIFSGQVSINHQGKNIYYKQSGYADWNTKRAIDNGTLFNIGSLNKQLTAEIIHQLVNEGKIAYADPLSKHLTLYKPAIGNKITIQHLLDMQAGLGDYLENPKFDAIRFTDFKMAGLLEIIKTEPLLFEPGTAKEYSNSGYVVLGAIIEKITNLSYVENVEARIAKPLGLSNIYCSRSQKAAQANRAFGTEIKFDGSKKSVDDISNCTPAGGIYTSIVDLQKFAEAKMNGTLPSHAKSGKGMVAGGTPFWNSVIYFNNENGYTFVVMANTGNIADELATRIKSIIKNEPYPPLKFPSAITLYQSLNAQGPDFVKSNLQQFADDAGLPLDARFLNFFGYQFLNAGEMEAALKLFKINVEVYPKDANAYDSLAEAFQKSGDKVNALINYKKALELDPENERIKNTIRKIEDSK